jgi:hypothetical protein
LDAAVKKLLVHIFGRLDISEGSMGSVDGSKRVRKNQELVGKRLFDVDDCRLGRSAVFGWCAHNFCDYSNYNAAHNCGAISFADNFFEQLWHGGND